jgi:hypothetical protein
MNTFAFWYALRAKLGLLDAEGGRGRSIAVQHLVLSQREVDAVQQALDRVGQQLQVHFVLQEHGGDIVLLDAQRAAQIAPQVVDAFTDGRPVVTLSNMRDDDLHHVPAAERLLVREAELLRQLREIPLVRRRATRRRGARSVTVGADSMQSEQNLGSTQAGVSTSFDTHFDSRLDVDQLQGVELDKAQLNVIHAVMQGLRDPRTAPLTASYGEGAHLRFDFAARRVHADALAEQYLRVQQELPKELPSELPRSSPQVRPQPHASVRDLHEVVWELGLACGPCHPLGAPRHWWHEPLCLRADARIDRYTRQPRHLAMALQLATGPATPSALRSQARVSVPELRRFIQACLMLGLVHWGMSPSHEETSS